MSSCRHLINLLGYYALWTFLGKVGGVQETLSRSEILNPRFEIAWTVNFEQKIVSFMVSAETTGWVGFGLSHTGGMTEADIVIGGVGSDGVAYLTVIIIKITGMQRIVGERDTR
jgi:hypothetical protein